MLNQRVSDFKVIDRRVLPEPAIFCLAYSNVRQSYPFRTYRCAGHLLSLPYFYRPVSLPKHQQQTSYKRNGHQGGRDINQ